jgi:hypothetical protein
VNEHQSTVNTPQISGFGNMIRAISSCHRGLLDYTRQVRLSWIFLRLVLLAAFPLVLAGCSGINSTQSVSPASFFLPGLLKNDVPTNAPSLTPEISTEVASVK